MEARISINTYDQKKKKNRSCTEAGPVNLQHINASAANPYLPICNIYGRVSEDGLPALYWNADSSEMGILIQLRVFGEVGGLNVREGQGNCCHFFPFFLSFFSGGKSVRWQRKGLAVAHWGPWGCRGRGGGGLLPVALAPTGSNLEQTVPNVFIRL